MPLHIIREDITRMAVDAIVAAGSAREGTPRPTGGVNGRIHQRAGERLLTALRRLGGVRTGGATLTEAYDLPCRYVIHTAGPVWQGGRYGEAELLHACYREALTLAQRQGFASVAFPLISTGQYGYPRAEALQIATRTIREFLDGHDMTVWLVVYDDEAFRISGELFERVEAFIDQRYVDRHPSRRNVREDMRAEEMCAPSCTVPLESMPLPCAAPEKVKKSAVPRADAEVPPGLARRLQQLDEGFADMLLRKIDERGMKDSACYRRANVDRKLFSKIRSTPGYTPKKTTVLAFCIALELSLEETREMMGKAGYSMTRSNVFDVVAEYFISHGIYDIDRINQVLFDYDMPLLGSDVK